MNSLKSTWRGMIARCYHESNKKYHRYGGRGIRVCERWRDSFEHFAKDMGPRPEGRSLDRINNDGNYEPNNCRWATQKQQNRNRSDNRMITFRGVTKTLPEWADSIGLSREALKRRFEHGWTKERALTEPRDQKYNPIRKRTPAEPDRET